MVHFNVFGGTDGQLELRGSVYINVFGGAKLTRLPFARQVVNDLVNPRTPHGSHFFFCLFGAVTLRWPTLAEETLALLEGLRSGAITTAHWDQAVARQAGASAPDIGSFSIFGGVDSDAIPSEDQELDDLTMQRHLGTLPEAAVETLMLGIGKRGSSRLAVVRQAVGLASAAT